MKRDSRQLFRKLQLVYTLVLVCAVGLLAAYSLSASKRQVRETNLEYMGMAGTEARDYILQCAGDADYVHNILYNSHNDLEELRHYICDDVEDYIRFRLDSYADSSSVSYFGLEDFFSSIFASNSQLVNIRLYSLQQEILTCFQADGASHREKRTSQQAVLAAEEAGRDGSGEAVCFQKKLLDPVSLKEIGWMELGFSGQRFSDIAGLYEKAQIIVCDSDNEAVFLSDSGIVWNSLRSLSDLEKEEGVHAREEAAGAYRVITILGKRDAGRISGWSFLAVLAVSLFLVVAGETGIYLYLSGIMRRLETIVDGMERVKQGDLGIRIAHGERSDELDIIADSFNRMCRDLDLYIKKSYLAEIEQKNAEMAALQSQINPHFLYNTLEAIRMKAICNGDREVGRMLYSMAALFQSQLKAADVITLAQELHYAKKYMELFEYRYHDKFTWEVRCGDGYLQVPVIKFVVQPVLENYFAHGIRLEADDNHVGILVRREGELLCIEVADNGRGMDAQEMAEKNAALRADELDIHKSMGLGNVNRRLKAVYGACCGLSLSENETGGITVTLKFTLPEGAMTPEAGVRPEKHRDEECDEKSDAGGG